MAGTTSGLRILTTGLQFPEGPVALDDGSLIVVEMARSTVTRVPPGRGLPNHRPCSSGHTERCGSRPGRTSLHMQQWRVGL